MAVKFSLSHWSGWTTPALVPSSSELSVRIAETPDASAIPTMLRRRLNTLGRAAAAEILRYTESQQHLPVVYSSRHGDIGRTLSVLRELAGKEPVSPMGFSLSVHNAVPGILSIHSGNTANITSLAALNESLVPTLLEATGLLQDGHPQVMCLFADVPIPDIYRHSCPEPVTPFAASFLVSSSGGCTLTLERAISPALPDARSQSLCESAAESWPEPLRFIEFLNSTTTCFETLHNGGAWTLSRH